MRNYIKLKKVFFSDGEYHLVPIRDIDRYKIMNWRNDQMYHLRQNKKLTEFDQDNYFNNIISNQFHDEEPDQMLFSFIENGECIGYGGIVHIDWRNNNAEISFLLDTSLEVNKFEFYWIKFLNLIQIIAFEELNLIKIYTYAYDLRPRLYEALRECQFVQEARLKSHIKINNEYFDILIHSKYNVK